MPAALPVRKAIDLVLILLTALKSLLIFLLAQARIVPLVRRRQRERQQLTIISWQRQTQLVVSINRRGECEQWKLSESNAYGQLKSFSLRVSHPGFVSRPCHIPIEKSMHYPAWSWWQIVKMMSLYFGKLLVSDCNDERVTGTHTAITSISRSMPNVDYTSVTEIPARPSEPREIDDYILIIPSSPGSVRYVAAADNMRRSQKHLSQHRGNQPLGTPTFEYALDTNMRVSIQRTFDFYCKERQRFVRRS